MCGPTRELSRATEPDVAGSLDCCRGRLGDELLARLVGSRRLVESRAAATRWGHGTARQRMHSSEHVERASRLTRATLCSRPPRLAVSALYMCLRGDVRREPSEASDRELCKV